MQGVRCGTITVFIGEDIHCHSFSRTSKIASKPLESKQEAQSRSHSPQREPTGRQLHLNFQPPELRDNTFLLFKPPTLWYFCYSCPHKLIQLHSQFSLQNLPSANLILEEQEVQVQKYVRNVMLTDVAPKGEKRILGVVQSIFPKQCVKN